MTGSLTLIWPAMAAAFLASLVEAVEALTIVLAVATVRGWRPAASGAFAGLVVLALIVAALGPLLGQVPLHLLQLVIGILLLLFGMRWLRKAILRAAGIIPLHDEATAFASETAELREQARRNEARLDWLAACVLVGCVGLVVHRPLARVPENTLKFAVGIMLSAFGVFWTGEGLGVNWPGADLAIVAFAALFLAAGASAVVLMRRSRQEVLP